MALIGLIMILINALGYIFNWDITSSALVIMGIVFVVIGMGMAKNSKASRK